MRLPGGRYLWHRVLRIMPGFWVCLVLTAFVFSPLAGLADGATWELPSALRYLRANSLLWIGQFGINNTLHSVPFPGAWSGTLWTLFYGFGAYLTAGLVLWPKVIRRHAMPIFWVMFVLAVVAVPVAYGPLHLAKPIYLNIIRLGTFFIAGMAMWTVKDRVPASGVIAAVCAVIIGILYFQPQNNFTMFAPVALAYVLLWLGGALPTRIDAKNDISYGIHIYAWSVQQLVVVAGANQWGLWPMLFVVMVGTIPLAWASFKLVEEPAMKLRNFRRRSVTLGTAG